MHKAAEPAFDAALGGRLEGAHEGTILQYVSSLRQIRPALGAGAIPVAGGHAIYAGKSPFSFAIGLGLRGPVSDRELDVVEAFFARRDVAAKIDVTPFAHESLGRLLKARGYRLEGLTSVLMWDFATQGVPRSEVEPHIEVRWAEPEECDTWVATLAKGFFVEDPGPERLRNMSALFQMPGAANAIAFADGVLAGVAGGWVPPQGDVATLFGSSVLTAHRRRGVHRELVRLRLEAGREAGCSLAMVTAHPGSDSERNLMRMGFAPCYVKATWCR